MTDNNVFKLSDSAIAQIAKLVQMAIISGTDVVDHLRLMEFCESNHNDSSLVLTEEYQVISETHIEKMLDELKDAQAHNS